MNFHFTPKRMHSPTDDYNTTAIMPEQVSARKKVMTDDMFTNKMAGLSLAHSTDNNTNQIPPPNTCDNNNKSGSGWRQDHVERVDDIDQYLDNDGNGTMEDDDTYLGAAPELVGVAIGTTMLPFERIPGATGLRIPDFVVHANDIDTSAHESALKQLHQYHDHHLPPSTSSSQPMPTDQYQPMDLD